MKRHLTKLSELQATLLLSGIVSVVLLGLSAIGFIFNQPGWMIGVAFGSVACVLSVWLSQISSTAALRDSKAFIYLLSYFGRMILFVGFFAFLVIMQYKVKNPVFTNSCWGMLIAFFPSIIVTIVVQMNTKGGNNGQVH